MRLDLSEVIRNVGKQAANEINEQCDPEYMGFNCDGSITGKLKFSNTSELLLITGNIHADFILECGRCLNGFQLPIDLTVEEEFRIDRTGDMIKAVPIDEDDDPELVFINNNILDVKELVRQNLLLEIPIKPLCDTECKGLCPLCGNNRNESPCSCNEEQNDSPFNILADLLDENEDEK